MLFPGGSNNSEAIKTLYKYASYLDWRISPHADRRHRLVCDLDLQPLKVIESEAHGSNVLILAVLDIFHVKNMTLIFDP